MRTVSLLGLVAAIGCAQAQDRPAGQIPSVAAPAGYTVHVVDDGWDRIEHGYIKARDIAVPPPNLTRCDAEHARQMERPVETEAAAELARLNELDWYSDGWREQDYVIVERSCYQAEEARIGFVRLRTTEREYEAMAIGLLRGESALQLYAEANTLEQAGTVVAYAEHDGTPVVYGHRPGNPNLPYGGAFALAFEGTERAVRYGYAEEGY